MDHDGSTNGEIMDHNRESIIQSINLDKAKKIADHLETQEVDHNGESIVQAINHDKAKKIADHLETQKVDHNGESITEPPFIENQETNFLDLPPSKNITRSFNHVKLSSMTGIFFIDSSSNPRFNFIRPHPKTTLPKPTFYSIPTPFAILSSSDGLLLCRDFLYFNYHVCNPFFQTPHSCRRLPPPSPSNDPSSHAVLATNGVGSYCPIFHVICLVEQTHKGNSCYEVEAYSSLDDAWLRPLLIKVGARVVENSGMADSYGFAYWLTESPHAIVSVGFTEDGKSIYGRIIDIEGCYPEPVKMQLGRIRMHAICLVYSNRFDVQFYMLLDAEQDKASFELIGCLEKEKNRVIKDVDLELVRFEKDAVLWVDGRVVLWQVEEVEEFYEAESGLHVMPRWVKVPEFIGDAVPYVYTEVLPSEFLNDYPEVVNGFP